LWLWSNKLINYTTIHPAKQHLEGHKFDNSRVSRSQNNCHDQYTGNHTLAGGNVHQPAIDS